MFTKKCEVELEESQSRLKGLGGGGWGVGSQTVGWNGDLSAEVTRTGGWT